MSESQTQLQKIAAAIAAQETLRGLVPDEQIEATLATLREQQQTLLARADAGSAIAQGEGAIAVTERGIVAQEISSSIINTGDYNSFMLPPLHSISATATPHVRNFLGRHRELTELKEKFDRHENFRVALLGMRGIGKSELALKLTSDLEAAFQDNIFAGYLREGNLREYEEKPLSILRTWSRICGQEFPAEIQIDGLIELVRGFLSMRQKEKGSILIILDDVEYRWISAAKILLSAIPENSHLIVTSVDARVSQELNIEPYQIDGLELKDALDLLRQYTGKEMVSNEYDEAICLIKNIGCSPMAIKFAGNWLKEPARKNLKSPIAHFLKLIETEIEPIFDIKDVSPRTTITFMQDYESLAEDAKLLFRWLSVFAPGEIWLDSILGVFQKGETQIDVNMHLNALYHKALIDWQEKRKSFRLHPLLYRYSQILLQREGEDENARKAHYKYFLEFVKRHAHIERVAHEALATSFGNISRAIRYANEINDHETVRDFGFALWAESHFLSMRGYANEALDILNKVISACKQINDLRGEGNAKGCVGLAYLYLGEYEDAISHLAQAYKISERTKNRSDQGVWLNYLGEFHRGVGEYKKARQYFERALNIFRDVGPDSRHAANGIGNLGLVFSVNGDIREAIMYYQYALKGAIRRKSPRDEALWRDQLGWAYRHLGQLETSTGFFEKALELHRHTGNLRAESKTLGDIGLNFYILGEVDSAISYFAKALKISEQIVDERGIYYAKTRLGIVYRHKGRLKKARQHFLQALKICIRHNDLYNQANIITELGICYQYQGHDLKAIEQHEKTLSIRKEINDRRGIGSSLGHIGNSYRNMGYGKKAIAYLEKALDIAEEVGDRRSEGNSLDNLGLVYYNQGERKKALEYFQKALEISKEIRHKRSETKRIGHIGKAYRALGEIQKGIDQLEVALNMSKAIKDLRSEGVHLGNLGLAYRHLEDYEKAKSFIQQALDIAIKVGDLRNQSIRIGNLGTIIYYQGDKKQAVEKIISAFRLSKKLQDLRGQGKQLANLGAIYRSMSELDKAISCYREALKIYLETEDLGGQAQTLNNWANVYIERSNFQKALEMFWCSLEKYKQLRNPSPVGMVQGNIGLLNLNLGKFEDAIIFCNKALKILQEYGPKRHEIKPWGTKGRSLLKLGRPDEAIECFEKAHSLCLEFGYDQMRSEQLQSFALVSLHKGQPKKALEFSLEALDLAKASENRVIESEILELVGQINQDLGRLRDAISYYEDALSLCEIIKNRHREFAIMKNLGELHQLLGQPIQAQDWFIKTEQIALDLNIQDESSRDNLEKSIQQVAQYYQAREHLKTAVELLQTINAPVANELYDYLEEMNSELPDNLNE